MEARPGCSSSQLPPLPSPAVLLDTGAGDRAFPPMCSPVNEIMQETSLPVTSSYTPRCQSLPAFPSRARVTNLC